MNKNQVGDVKITIKPNIYLTSIQDICNKGDGYLEMLYDDLSNISQIPMDKWFVELQPEDTFPLYLTGLKATEIAHIRGVSRQTESNRLSQDFEKLLRDGFVNSLDEFKEDHELNRRLLQEIIIKYFVYKASKEKNIKYMENILGSKYNTDRSKYIAYIKLGGNPNSFTLDSLDKRFATAENDIVVKQVYDLFKQGLDNNKIASELNIEIHKVYYLRKKYIKLKNPILI